MKLNLGVLEQLYGTPASKERSRGGSVVSTGQVAEWLEDEYHVMEHFFQLHQETIGKALSEDMAASLETMLAGGSTELKLGEATSQIEDMFKKMISDGELERLGYPGIPTQAALKGVNHRLRHPYAKANPRRPSFRDTGLYQASFKAWIE